MQIQLKNKSIELYQHRDHKNKQAQHEIKKAGITTSTSKHSTNLINSKHTTLHQASKSFFLTNKQKIKTDVCMRCIDRSNTPVTWTRRKRFRMKQDEFIPHAQTLSLCSSLLEKFGCSGWTPIKQTETHGCVLHSGIFVAGQRRAIHKDVACFCDSALPA